MKKTSLHVTNFAVRESNPNVLNFSATAGFIGIPTRGTPEGGDKGYKVVIDKDSVTNVEELIGAGVNCSYGWGRDFKEHRQFFKIGVIDDARVENDTEIHVTGHLWKTDFADVCDTIESAKDSLGCSVEVYSDGFSIDDENKIQTLTGAHFTGMSIVYKNKAAFDNTRFMCALMEEKETEMTETDLKTFTQMFSEEIDKRLAKFDFDKLSEDIDKKFADRIKAIEDKNEEKLSALREEIKASFAQKESETPPTPERKTTLEFDSAPQLKPAKTVMSMAEDVDNDPSLTIEQRWAKKMSIWKQHQEEGGQSI